MKVGITMTTTRIWSVRKNIKMWNLKRLKITEIVKCTQSSSSLMLLGSELKQGLLIDVSRQCEYCLMKSKDLVSKEKTYPIGSTQVVF